MALTLWLLRRVSFRHWRLAPGQSALLVLILGLGVAAFLSIRLANRAAVSSFQDFTETLTGSSDWVIEAPSGSLPESVLGEVRRGLGARSVAMVPVVESTATLVEPGVDASEPPSFSLLGIDVVGIANAASARNRSDGFSAGGASGSRGWDPFKTGTLAWVPGGYSGRESLSLLIDDRIVKVAVAGAIPATAGVPAPGNLIVMDLPELQRLTGKVGRVDRVEFVIGEGPGAPQLRSEVGALLTTMGEKGARWTVRSPGARRETLSAYVKRLEKLEELALSFEGIKKAYALQAGREVRVIVEEDFLDDEKAAMLARDIAKKVEQEMTFPGQIKINVIREKRSIEYAR